MIRLLCWLLRNKVPDIKSLVADIPVDYLPTDRYRDFVNTFSTPEGKRVLATIVGWGHVYKPSMNTDPNLVIFCEGERNMALKILAACTAPQSNNPKTQVRK